MQIVGFASFVSAALLALAFGARYVLTRTFMPYHAAVLDKQWAVLEPRLQIIILGMLAADERYVFQVMLEDLEAGVLGCSASCRRIVSTNLFIAKEAS